MKKAIIVCDGAADAPLEELDGRTPLQVARCPHAAALVEAGQTGLVSLPKAGIEEYSEQLLAQLLGMPVEKAALLHRGPLELRGAGIDASGYSYAYCANLVTLDGDVLRDSLVRSLSLEETRYLAKCLQDEWDVEALRFVVTEPSRLIVLCAESEHSLPCGYPPHLAERAKIDEYVRPKKGDGLIHEVLLRSRTILENQSLNEIRVDLGENPANALWLWGGGSIEGVRELFSDFRFHGTMLTQSLMASGFARLAGMDVVELTPTAALVHGGAFSLPILVQELRSRDWLIVYAEASGPGGRYGAAVDKIRSLEAFDQHLLAPLVDVLAAHRPYRVILGANCVVSTETGLPAAGRIPFVLAGDGVGADDTADWNEDEASRGALGSVKLNKMMDLLA